LHASCKSVFLFPGRRTPLATFLEFKSDVLDMDLDEERWLWVTVGADKVVKVWDIKSTLCP
jgi:hypothetical protein